MKYTLLGTRVRALLRSSVGSAVCSNGAVTPGCATVKLTATAPLCRRLDHHEPAHTHTLTGTPTEAGENGRFDDSAIPD